MHRVHGKKEKKIDNVVGTWRHNCKFYAIDYYVTWQISVYHMWRHIIIIIIIIIIIMYAYNSSRKQH